VKQDTTPNIAKLTPRERETFKALYTPGSTTTVDDLAARFGVRRDVVVSYVGKCRLKLGERFVPATPNPHTARSVAHKAARAAKAITPAHVVPGYGRCANLPHDPDETRAEKEARVAREIAAGSRCGRCRLLNPCVCAVEGAA
jgi:hypothetical protein